MKPQPGLREHRLVADIVRLVVAYLGRSVERQLIVRALTRRGMPLAAFRPADFAARVDVGTLIA